MAIFRCTVRCISGLLLTVMRFSFSCCYCLLLFLVMWVARDSFLFLRSQSSNTFYNPLNTHFIVMLATIMKRMNRLSVHMNSVLTVAHHSWTKVSAYTYGWNALRAISHIWLTLMFIYCRYNQLFTKLITLQTYTQGLFSFFCISLNTSNIENCIK
jgi:hypothetical protein